MSSSPPVLPEFADPPVTQVIVSLRPRNGSTAGDSELRVLKVGITASDGELTVVIQGNHEEHRWLPPTLERLRELVSLPANWNSYGAPPIKAAAAVSALQLLKLPSACISR